jgi:hypothetical protein
MMVRAAKALSKIVRSIPLVAHARWFLRIKPLSPLRKDENLCLVMHCVSMK